MELIGIISKAALLQRSGIIFQLISRLRIDLMFISGSVYIVNDNLFFTIKLLI